MDLSKEQIMAAKYAKSIEDIGELAAKWGINMTAVDLENVYAMLQKNGELNDDELGNVSGGG